MNFCSIHVNEHREELNGEMEEIILKRDRLHEMVTEQNMRPDCHPLIERINEWESQSIIKIRQSADETRQNLLNILHVHRKRAIEILLHLTEEISSSRKENDYVEIDLKQWTKKLKQLKKDLLATQIIRFPESDEKTTLISKILIDHTTYEYFENLTGDIERLENGKIIKHGPTNSIGIARGRNEYSSKQHRFHFQVTHRSSNSGCYFGIVSKPISNQSLLRALPSNRHLRRTNRLINTPTFLHRNEEKHGFVYFHKIDSDMNYIVELIIDCDRQKVYLNDQNEQEIVVNINQCPFPWQLFVGLLHPADRVRLSIHS